MYVRVAMLSLKGHLHLLLAPDLVFLYSTYILLLKPGFSLYATICNL